jgi:hypothetical protein
MLAMYSHHEESQALINASPDQVFAALDDHGRLSSHMGKSSWRMGGGRMETVVDASQGRTVGSHIVLRGRVFGVRLFVEEVVMVHEPPVRKAWETIGAPQLLVIGPYMMSFELAASGTGARLRVVIEYELPEHGTARVLGWLFGRMYARWCTRQRVGDARMLFAAPASVA